MSKPSQFIVLAEDELHQRFVRKFLQRLYTSPQIRNMPLPNSRGCGEQWVRERYATEVRAFRTRAARAASVLVVVIDADTEEVDRRHRQLLEALENDDLQERRVDEAIVHFVPKRNIETWIFCLNGQPVDELMDYSERRVISDQVSTAGITFFDWSRPGATIPADCVPSLLTAIPEVRRLPPE